MLKLLKVAVAAALVLQPVTGFSGTDPVTTVVDFNKAVTDRDMDAALAELAEGSVQIQLRAVHPGMSDNPPLTADLITMWKAVAAILFPVSKSYERTAIVTDENTVGEVATVWADTTTVTVSNKEGKEPLVISFSEVYLVVKKDGEWKIATIADNRGTDDIAVAE